MAEQLFQVGVKALVRNKEGKLLLEGQKRAPDKPVTYDIIGGRIDANESILQTLYREMQEEIGAGYVGTPEIFATTLTKLGPVVHGQEVGLVIIVYTVSLPALNISSHNPLLKWLTPAEAAKEIAFKYDDDFCRKVAAL